MKIYIAGQITGLNDYKEIFAKAEEDMVACGNVVMNPAVLNTGFAYEEYMEVCFSMIDVCDGVYMLSNWNNSPGAKREMAYAIRHNKDVYLETPTDSIRISDYTDPTPYFENVINDLKRLISQGLVIPRWKTNRTKDGLNLTDKCIICVESSESTYTIQCHISVWDQLDIRVYTHAPEDHVRLSSISELEGVFINQ